MMRWNATLLPVFLVSMLVVLGCESNTEDPVSQVSTNNADSLRALAPIDSNPSMLSRSVESSYTSSDDAIYDRTAASDPTMDSALAGGKVHIVQAGDTLYSLARRYYQTGQKWPRILDANRARLSDPNRLQVGMKLIIP